MPRLVNRAPRLAWHHAARLRIRQRLAICALMLAAGCGSSTPPENRAYGTLPLTGDRAFAEKMGFGTCANTSNALRCRREGVMLLGQGPYSAAVDLGGWKGGAGFHKLILWHDRDQHAVSAVGDALERQGWTLCRTGREDRGDQEIYTKPGSAVRFSIDLSYWGKRRIQVLPEQGQPTGKCW